MERNKNLTPLSQTLRKNATNEENTLWYQYLRRYPVQLRRQCIFGNYIVDFYCAKARLVLELDGSQHFEPDSIIHDAERTQYLESLGLEVLRFSNTDVNRNLSGVCQAIDLTVQNRILSASNGAERNAYTSIPHSGAAAPHPPLSGAPSPPRGRFSERRFYVQF